jgi:two-component system, chemotaxis family, chemotaxis protein CheY
MLAIDDRVIQLLGTKKVLIVDDEHYTRKVVRTLLQTLGVKSVYEVGDGHAGLDAICTYTPDVVLVDYEMPGLDGPGFVRAVRSPGTFPYADIPLIMLTAHSERSKVIEAARLGVNEYLLKPVSSQALQARLLSVLLHPRPMIRKGDYYGPEPRKTSTLKADNDEDYSTLVLVN